MFKACVACARGWGGRFYRLTYRLTLGLTVRRAGTRGEAEKSSVEQGGGPVIV